MKRHTTTALIFACVFASAPGVRAVPIATEDFESYTLSDVVGQTGGGAGWTGNWTRNEGDANWVSVVSGGLNYSAGAVGVNGGSQALQVNYTPAENGGVSGNVADGLLIRSLSSAQTGTVYMSLLFRETANAAFGDDFASFGFDPTATNNNPNVSIMRRNGVLQARSNTGAANSNGSTATALNQTRLLVFKSEIITPTNYDQVTLFVDPTTATEPGVNEGQSSFDSGIASLGDFVVRTAFHEAGDTYQIDNIRIGTSWADVVSINPNLIASYELEVASNVAQDAADHVGANTTAGNFQAFIDGSLSTVPGVGGAGISAGSGNAFLDRNLTGTTTTAATDDYLTFTVIPDAGFEFTFDNITFDYLVQQNSGITYAYELRSSIDNFATVLGTANNVGAPFSFAEDIDLSFLAAQSSPVEFRFMFSDTNDGAGFQHRIDNVLLFGTVSAFVVIPEPSTFILSGLGLMSLGLVGWRRRRR